VIGTAPSHELLQQWVERESCVAEAQKRVHGEDGVGVALPQSKGAYIGQEMDEELRKAIYAEGARTSPGREHGGNIDIATLTRGAKVWLPVFVPGAKLSVGDTHFCQSDGEPTTAIEMPGVVTLRVNVVKNGVELLGLKSPMYQTSPSEPTYPNKLVFTGLSVTPDGKQTDRDGMTAYRNAAWQAMQYLEKQGYSREQAYVILSATPVESKVVATANQPNMVISVALPVDIFQFDILPRSILNAKPEITGPALLTEERAKVEEQKKKEKKEKADLK
jgi:formamidase